MESSLSTVILFILLSKGTLTLETMAKQGENTVGLVLGSPTGICLPQNSSVKKPQPGHFNPPERKALHVYHSTPQVETL